MPARRLVRPLALAALAASVGACATTGQTTSAGETTGTPAATARDSAAAGTALPGTPRDSLRDSTRRIPPLGDR
jgi:hypothetical protein